jgi:hypothetical protein
MEHSRNALALITHIAEIDESSDRPRIAARMEPFLSTQTFNRNSGHELAWISHLHTIIEEPHFCATPSSRIVSVSHRVEYRFLPGKLWILRHRLELRAHQSRRAPQQATDHFRGLFENGGQIALYSRPLLYIMFWPEATLGPYDAEDPNSGVRVVWAIGCKDEFGCATQADPGTTSVGQLST